MSYKDLFENEGIKPSITIQLKDKIDEKVFGDILIKEGLTKISIEMKNSEKSIVYNYFKFIDETNLDNIATMCIIVLDAESSCIYYVETISREMKEIGGNLFKTFNPSTSVEDKTVSMLELVGGLAGGLYKGAFGAIADSIKDKDIENLEGWQLVEKAINKINKNKNDFIDSMKEILFREKILDEVYDKSGEYENNQNKYEADTDDIIEKIDYNMPSRPHYEAFIIKHFIKYVMDKYKQEIS
ncbi:hypothetical protein [Brachyspira catarrhinii]|uniref:DUF4365 domain-containing protein n=1 Tax=Brachyspira catarrhinii TaxID=2528966 RepID=A0ABY2TR10_9SPIR|nr:hypothetical protein [Brachyspira catarrhinii]TKZ29428.1 hypothetical protein EZH24_11025 [Brachyspira catarrhinii]